VKVRKLARSDLHRAVEFCERARVADPKIEPFASRLPAIAQGPRALRDLWRVAEEEDGAIEGIAFAALRQAAGPGHARATVDVYAAVAPPSRRRGLGAALCAPAMRWAEREHATLRARVHESALAGQAFVANLGFRQTAAQLLLSWSRRPLDLPWNRSVRVREIGADEAMPQLERLARDAWAGTPDAFPSAADDLAGAARDDERLLLVAEDDGRAVGYLSGAWLEETVAIDELAVLPRHRKSGIGRALLTTALRDALNAVLFVSESNDAGRSLYRSLGFRQSQRRLVYELRHE
jgi:[ribosomal protein S18]-alanine N-acetyltransferase